MFCVLASFVNTGNQPCFRSGLVQFICTMQCQQNTALTWTAGHHARWRWEPCLSCWPCNWLSPLGLSAVYPVGTNSATGGNMTVSYNGDHELHEMVHHNCITGYLPEGCQWFIHTPSIAFWHLPLNSVWFGYVTEGVLFISMQLSTNTVSAFWKVWVLVRLWKQPSTQACM